MDSDEPVSRIKIDISREIFLPAERGAKAFYYDGPTFRNASKQKAEYLKLVVPTIEVPKVIFDVSANRYACEICYSSRPQPWLTEKGLSDGGPCGEVLLVFAVKQDDSQSIVVVDVDRVRESLEYPGYPFNYSSRFGDPLWRNQCN